MAYINLCHYLIFSIILDGREDALQPFIDLLDQERNELLETPLIDNQKPSIENDNGSEDEKEDSTNENNDEDPPAKKK
jgi:hypothetical protein